MISAKYKLEEAEFLVGVRLFTGRRRRSGFVILLAVGVAMTVAAALLTDPAWLRFVWPRFMALFLFIFVVMRFAADRINRRTFRSVPDFSSEISLELSDDYTVMRTATSESSRKWAAYARALEDVELFVLTGPGALMIIPKRVFAPSDLDAVRQLITSKVPLTSRR